MTQDTSNADAGGGRLGSGRRAGARSIAAPTIVDGRAPQRMAGRYELLSRLGIGGMGEVFLAELAGPFGFRKRFAIKRLRDELMDDTGAYGLFLREATLVARLRHPCVCQVFELGEDDAGVPFIVMEHLDGVTLAQVLAGNRARGATLPIAVVLAVIERLCSALAAAHELRGDDGAWLGLVHRDVSPSNVMITSTGEVKLLDFGVAKIEPVQTRVGLRRGKFSYMSPEQVEGGRIDRRTDLFAVGVVLFEMLTSTRLFDQGDPSAVAHAIINAPVPDLLGLRPDAPPALQAVLNRALARARAARFSRADQLRTALLAAVAPISPASVADLARIGRSEDERVDFDGGVTIERARTGSEEDTDIELVALIGDLRALSVEAVPPAAVAPAAVAPPAVAPAAVVPTLIASREVSTEPIRKIQAALPWRSVTESLLGVIVAAVLLVLLLVLGLGR